MMRKKKFPKIDSLDDKKNAELYTNQINRNREIQKEYALAEKQTLEDMKKLKRQKIAAMKRIKQTCKKEKSLISYYNQLSC
ncbi:MAG: hypothetical protein KAJ62_01985 [Desulfobacteraceae bacterium]|nr:hypothetical protein [Desulfobacteraceae bacterium]